MGVPSLNDLDVDGTLNTTNQPTNQVVLVSSLSLKSFGDNYVNSYLIQIEIITHMRFLFRALVLGRILQYFDI